MIEQPNPDQSGAWKIDWQAIHHEEFTKQRESDGVFSSAKRAIIEYRRQQAEQRIAEVNLDALAIIHALALDYDGPMTEAQEVAIGDDSILAALAVAKEQP